ncbi:extracellular solute-binding protein [Streptomyces sp. NPDC004752]
MSISKRAALGASLALVASVALVGCGSSGATTSGSGVATATALDQCKPSGRTITVAYAQQGETAARRAKAQMEKKFPKLSVELRETNVTTYDQLTQAVTADIAAGRRPDVAMVGLSQVSYYVDQYKPQPIDTSSLRSTYITRYLAAGTIGGKAYVAPFQLSVPVLYMNKTLAAKAGVTSAPTTTGQLIEAAKKIKAATGTAPVQVPQDSFSDWIVQALVQSAGGAYIKGDGTAGFDTAAGREAISLYQTLGKDGLQDPISVNDARTAFQGGRIAFMIDSPSIAASTKAAVGGKFAWDVSAMPVPSVQKTSLPAGGNGWMVLSQDPCQAAYANEMISLMLDPDVIAASAKQFSYIPVDRAAAKTLAADPAAHTPVGYSWKYEGTPTTWDAWPGTATGRVNQIVQQMVQHIIRGGDTNSEVSTTVRQINAAVK